MNNPTIDDIFDQLDRDRHLAGFPLEERASPYFRQFLPEVLEEHYKKVHSKRIEIDREVIPEFPLRHGTLGIKTGPNVEIEQ